MKNEYHYFKHILMTIAVICLLVIVMPAARGAYAEDNTDSGDAAAEIVASGTYTDNGADLTWTLDSDGVFTLSGKSGWNSFNNEVDIVWHSYRASIKKVVIEDGVDRIWDNAFSGCKNLKSVSIPDSVTAIGYQAFTDCSGLTEITIPDKVTKIGDYTFRNCSGLKSMVIPDGVTSIGNNLFENCSKLKSITVPDGVTQISYGAFKGCSSLTSFKIPSSMTQIGEFIFADCTSLTSITVPEGIELVDYYAFSGCTNLTSITLPDSLTFIGQHVFQNCTKLPAIYIPKNVDYVGEYAFKGCKNLTIYCAAGKAGKDWEDDWNPACSVVYSTTRAKFNKVKSDLVKAKALKKPTFKVKALKGRKIKLTWGKVKNADGYIVYIKYPGKKKFKKALTKKATIKSVVHKGLSRNRVYYYKVRAYKKVSGKYYYGPYSKVRKAKVR